MSTKWGKILRATAVIAAAMAAAFTLIGGAGTSCVAWNADTYGRAFAAFVPYMPVYQLFVYINAVTGIVGLWLTYRLVRGGNRAYAGIVGIVCLYLVTAGVQMWYSSTLKEVSFFDTAPNSMRLYVYALTLILFIIVKLPDIRDMVDFTAPWRNPKSGAAAGGLAAIAIGALTLATPAWASANHLLGGENLVYVMIIPLTVIGGLALTLGMGLMAYCVNAERPAVTASRPAQEAPAVSR
jgi:hypothetical protein